MSGPEKPAGRVEDRASRSAESRHTGHSSGKVRKTCFPTMPAGLCREGKVTKQFGPAKMKPVSGKAIAFASGLRRNRHSAG